MCGLQRTGWWGGVNADGVVPGWWGRAGGGCETGHGGQTSMHDVHTHNDA